MTPAGLARCLQPRAWFERSRLVGCHARLCAAAVRPHDRPIVRVDMNEMPCLIPSPPRAPAPRRATVRSIGPAPAVVAARDLSSAVLDTGGRGRDRLRSGHLAHQRRQPERLRRHRAARPTSSSDTASRASSPARRPRGSARSSRPSSPATQDVSRAMVDIQRPDGAGRRPSRSSSSRSTSAAGGSRARRDRPRHRRTDRGPGPPPAAGPGRARAGGRAQRGHPGDGRGASSCAPPTARSRLTNPAGERLFPDVEEQTYADILAQLDDPDGAAPALGHAGRPGRAPDPGRSGSLDRDRDAIRSTSASASRPPARRRSSSCATSPRPADARPSARRSSASCRTSCGRR